MSRPQTSFDSHDFRKFDDRSGDPESGVLLGNDAELLPSRNTRRAVEAYAHIGPIGAAGAALSVLDSSRGSARLSDSTLQN